MCNMSEKKIVLTPKEQNKKTQSGKLTALLNSNRNVRRMAL